MWRLLAHRSLYDSVKRDFWLWVWFIQLLKMPLDNAEMFRADLLEVDKNGSEKVLVRIIQQDFFFGRGFQ